MKLKTNFFVKLFFFILTLCLCACSGLDQNIVKLKSSNSLDRVEAISWLDENAKGETTDKLIEQALTKDKSPIVRSLAIRLMVKSQNTKYIPSIIKALDDENYLVRMEAAQSIGSFHAFEFREILGQKLETETHTWVKLKLIKSLRYLKSKHIILPLINVLDDESPAVRFQALITLEKFTKQDFGLQIESWKNWHKASTPENKQ